MKVSDISKEVLKRVINPIEIKIKGVNTYSDASQIFCDDIYKEFEESIVLVRVFLSIPYNLLPEKKQDFVKNLLGSGENRSLLKNETKMLTLMGTYGENKEWNSAHLSRGHIAIPLLSESFIEAIPMMNGLLNQLGFNWSSEKTKDYSNEKSSSAFSGIFYIKNASQEVDDKGRKIIANQEFVQRYHVKSVLGFGGGYIGSDNFFTAIAFLNEEISRSSAETFSLIGNNFKMATKDFIGERTGLFYG